MEAMYRRLLDNDILFIQQEHADTLKALHEEIYNLQKKCTDLTFQLTMHGITVEDQGDVDDRVKQVQQQLQEAQIRESQLQVQLSKGAQQLQQLQQELRVQQKQHMDEVRQMSQSISSLHAEVEAKSNNITFLTTELHKLKVRQKVGAGDAGGVRGRQGAEPGPSIVRRTQPQHSHLPAPPRNALNNSARLRHRVSHPQSSPICNHSRPAPVPAIKPSRAQVEVVARPHRVSSVSTPSSSGSDSVDITPFVKREQDTASPKVEVKKSTPLPPITPSVPHTPAEEEGLGERDSPVDRKDLGKAVQASKDHRSVSQGQASTPEVATLAVDKVSDGSWASDGSRKRRSQPSSESK